jgi:hypothetical protein
MDFPPDPIAAATHPDPYPYYARSVADRPSANARVPLPLLFLPETEVGG